MNKRRLFNLSLLGLIISALACNLPGSNETHPIQNTPTSEQEIAGRGEQATAGDETIRVAKTPKETRKDIEPDDLKTAATITPGIRLQPSDLSYLGAFRLPDPSGGSNWEYSGHALTYFPEGDPDSADDGFSGSLFGVGHDHQLFVSEISIPAPVNSPNLSDLNTATTLQPFADLSGGLFNPKEMAIPRLGIEYLPPQDNQTSAKLHFVWGQHIQDFELSHGWAEMDLSNPQPAGPWYFNGYTNYVTSDYLFEIPKEWSDSYAPGLRLATGRAREGLWSGRGPGLFAYAPWFDGNPPPPETILTAIRPLLLYGVQEPGVPDIVSDESMAAVNYSDSDHWMGGAWLTSGEKSAVIFVGTKALGNAWYGFANGVVWDYDCADTNTCPDVPEWPYENRGFWADDYEAQIIFFDPAELAAVVTGRMETWEPQPYAALSIQDILYEPELNFREYKRDLVGAAAFDRQHGLLYIFERLADEYKSVIHVWRINGG